MSEPADLINEAREEMKAAKHWISLMERALRVASPLARTYANLEKRLNSEQLPEKILEFDKDLGKSIPLRYLPEPFGHAYHIVDLYLSAPPPRWYDYTEPYDFYSPFILDWKANWSPWAVRAISILEKIDNTGFQFSIELGTAVENNCRLDASLALKGKRRSYEEEQEAQKKLRVVTEEAKIRFFHAYWVSLERHVRSAYGRLKPGLEVLIKERTEDLERLKQKGGESLERQLSLERARSLKHTSGVWDRMWYNCYESALRRQAMVKVIERVLGRNIFEPRFFAY